MLYCYHNIFAVQMFGKCAISITVKNFSVLIALSFPGNGKQIFLAELPRAPKARACGASIAI